MRIMKFGGTSVGTSSAIDRTTTILATAHREEGPIVAVVSAMSGITNLLLDTAGKAAQGQPVDPADFRWELAERHLAVVGELIRDSHRSADVSTAITALAERCARLIESVQVLEDLSPRVRDWIVSFGERMSATLVAAVLADRGVPSEPVDADRLIVTDSDYGNGSPLLDQTREMVSTNLRPLVEQGALPVVTGFFGANSQGVTVTIGRGGSDFSAAILGNALDAEEVVIWTDVDGVMTADPRLVPDARTLPAVTYAEARELAYFGAKVVHPRTMQPAAERGIALRIKNTFRPDSPGTEIGPEPQPQPEEKATCNGSAKAITSIPGLSVISVEGAGLIDVADVTARVFTTVARVGVNVFMISQASSQHSLSFVVSRSDAGKVVGALKDEFELDLLRDRLIGIFEDPDLAIVAVIGSGMRGTPGVSGKVFSTLGRAGINVVSIAQGSSELNISCAILQSEVGRAVAALHRAFGLAGVDQPAGSLAWVD